MSNTPTPMDKQTAEEYLKKLFFAYPHSENDGYLMDKSELDEYARLRSEEVAVKFGFYVAAEMFAAMKGVTRDQFLTDENRISVMKTIMEQFNSPEFQQYIKDNP